ncbi:unnamed protein product [Rhizopus stolonifer]
MATSPKLPNDCDKSYILNEETRKKVMKFDYLLIKAVSNFGDLWSHIDSLPEELLLNENPESMDNEIKTALYKLISEDYSIVLPVKIREYIRKVYGYFSNRKTKERFLKAFNRKVEASEPRLQEREVAQARKNTYQKAQLLGTSLTTKGLDEFEREYIDAPTAQVSLETTTSSMKKSCTLNKNKKTFVIFNTAAYLTSPNKPKIQYLIESRLRTSVTLQ